MKINVGKGEQNALRYLGSTLTADWETETEVKERTDVSKETFNNKKTLLSQHGSGDDKGAMCGLLYCTDVKLWARTEKTTESRHLSSVHGEDIILYL